MYGKSSVSGGSMLGPSIHIWQQCKKNVGCTDALMQLARTASYLDNWQASSWASSSRMARHENKRQGLHAACENPVHE